MLGRKLPVQEKPFRDPLEGSKIISRIPLKRVLNPAQKDELSRAIEDAVSVAHTNHAREFAEDAIGRKAGASLYCLANVKEVYGKKPSQHIVLVTAAAYSGTPSADQKENIEQLLTHYHSATQASVNKAVADFFSKNHKETPPAKTSSRSK